MQIRLHSLQHSAVKLLLLCPALLSSGWLYTWYAYGEVTLLSYCRILANPALRTPLKHDASRHTSTRRKCGTSVPVPARS